MSRKNVEDIYPLSPLQQGMLFHALYSPEGGAYVEQWPLLVEGPLDADAFHRALGRVVQRHPALRTGFVWEGVPQPLQVVYRHVEVPAEHEDWADGSTDARWRERLDGWMAEQRRAGFDLKTAPLVRLAFLRVGDDRHVVVFSFHHILIDAWAAGIVLADWMAFYVAETGGPAPQLPPAPRYRDYVGWLARQDAGAAEAFWRGALSGFAAATPLPFDLGGDDVAERHAAERLVLDAGLSARLNALARERALTVNTLVQGAWALLLARHAGTDDVVFGTTVSGRPADLPGVERMVGLFINTLPVRVGVPADARVGEWLAALQARQAEARQHEHARLADVQGWADAPRDRPLFGSIVVFENAPSTGGDGGESPLRISGLPVVEGSTYPLTLVVVPGAVMELRLAWDTRRFTAAGARRMLDGLAALLTALAERPDARLADVSPMAANDAAALAAWGTGPALDKHGPLFHHTFESWAARTPEAVALVSGDERLTYAEVNARANRLARRLAALGVAPEARVAVCVERSAELVVALLAVLKAGGCYVPLDPAYPAERLAYMAQDSGAAVLVTRGPVPHALAGTCPAALSVEADAGAIGAEDGANLDVDVAPESLAYTIYTSGSTGLPKAVMVAHADAAAHCQAAAQVYGQTASDRVLQFVSASFDVSIEQILTPLSVGACIVMRGADVPAPAELADLVRREGVTLVNPPTAYWHELVNDERACAAIRGSARLVLAGGEAMSPAAARRWLATPGGARLMNVYGPTETVVTSTGQEVDARAAAMPGAVSVGGPFPGRRAYVVADAGRLCAPGEPGELWIGGPLARGYLGRPALTAERFIPDPFSDIAGARLYRTGDRARWTEDGRLAFLGRADEQVKVRGYRVEPGEVESALAALPGVASAAVAAHGGRLVAYVVARDGAAPDPAAMKDALSAQLPEFMVPSAFVALDRLPMTPGGKVDRRALAAPDASSVAASESYVAPRNPTEQALADIWREVLPVDRVGVADSFFALGGHSLVAMQVTSRIRQVLGVDVPLRAVFDAPTLGALAARVDASRFAGDEGPPLVRALRGDTAPLSFAQERMWFLDRLLPGTALYNLPFRVTVRGAVDPEALRAALEDLVRRHEPLRTTLAERGGQPVQVIAAAGRFSLPVTDLTHLPAEKADAEAARIAHDEALRPFDLAAGPLFRARLLRRAPDAWTLLMDAHHAVTDGWSMNVFYRELSDAYEARRAGRRPEWTPLAVQYADFAAWQREYLSGERLRAQLGFWRERLAGVPALELPTDRPRPAAPIHRGATLDFSVPSDDVEAVLSLARNEDATPFMALLAAFGALLWKYTGQTDFAIGSLVAGRTRAETEPLVGMFVNTLPLRVQLSGEMTFRELVRRARETTLDAHAHQDLPFERLVDELRVERSLSRHPVFQVAFTVEERPHGSEWRLGDAVAVQPDSDTGTAKFDLMVGFTPEDGGLVGGIEYAAELFDESMVRRMADHLLALLSAAAAEPDRPLSRLPGLLRGEDRRAVLEGWGHAPHPVPDTAVHVLVRAQAERTPHAVALEMEGVTLSYAEMEARANRLAHHLIGRGVGRETVVGVLALRAPETIIALLAVLKAGGAYLPLDPAYPAERLAFMVADAGARIVIDPLGGARAVDGVEMVDSRAEAGAIAAHPSTDPDIDIDSRQLAYVIYTSGSTGTPKGVLVEHGGVPNLALASARRLGLRPGGRVLHFTRLSFDVSVSELFATLTSGATLVVADADSLLPGRPLADTLGRECITALHAPPSVLAVTPADDLPELSAVVSGGEALASAVARPWAAGRTLLNGYGPTETTVYATYAHVRADAEGEPHIGTGVENARVYVLDAAGEPLPAGIPGELYIGGVGVARGYRGRPGLTAERFVPDAFAATPGARAYRTGDRVRWRADGTLEFMGRLDDQVKLRGFRVEPGEVSAWLAALPGVRDAFAMARQDGPGEPRLVAYATPADAARPPAPAELRAALARSLPDYLVPSAIVVMDALPLTPNGKVDRRALPVPDGAGQGRAYVAPGTDAEKALAELWSELLGVERVGVDDGFFELGGHSLLATRMVSALRQRMEIDLPLRDVFDTPRLGDLAARISAALDPALTALMDDLDGLSDDELLALLEASAAPGAGL